MKVLVGIPTLNGAGRLARALDSILQHTDLEKFNTSIVVVDDGSVDDQATLINQIVIDRQHMCDERYGRPGVKLVVNVRNKGIAYSWNTAVGSDVGSDIIILLNDDVEVVRHWQDALVYTIRHNPQFGMVGLNFVNGVCTTNPSEAGRNFIPESNFFVATPLVGEKGLLAANGVAFGFERKKWKEVEGFDELYFAFWEEVDFGTSLASKGYVNCMLDRPLLYHMGGATFAQNFSTCAGEIMSESEQKFLEKWGMLPAALYEKLLPSPRLLEHVTVWDASLPHCRIA